MRAPEYTPAQLTAYALVFANLGHYEPLMCSMLSELLLQHICDPVPFSKVTPAWRPKVGQNGFWG